VYVESFMFILNLFTVDIFTKIHEQLEIFVYYIEVSFE
jgi:hypothetical protein